MHLSHYLTHQKQVLDVLWLVSWITQSYSVCPNLMLPLRRFVHVKPTWKRSSRRQQKTYNYCNQLCWQLFLSHQEQLWSYDSSPQLLPWKWKFPKLSPEIRTHALKYKILPFSVSAPMTLGQCSPVQPSCMVSTRLILFLAKRVRIRKKTNYQ